MTSFIDLFFCFLIPGLLGFGGGPGSIGIIQAQTVTNYGFLDISQFNQILGITQALPGPIATKLAFAIGFVKLGFLGGVVATIAIMIPSIILIIFLYSFLVRNKSDYRAKRISKYIMPVVIALFVKITYDFFAQSFGDIDNNIHVVILFIISFITLGLPYVAPDKFKYNIHPLFLIIFSMVYGYFII